MMILLLSSFSNSNNGSSGLSDVTDTIDSIGVPSNFLLLFKLWQLSNVVVLSLLVGLLFVSSLFDDVKLTSKSIMSIFLLLPTLWSDLVDATLLLVFTFGLLFVASLFDDVKLTSNSIRSIFLLSPTLWSGLVGATLLLVFTSLWHGSCCDEYL